MGKKAKDKIITDNEKIIAESQKEIDDLNTEIKNLNDSIRKSSSKIEQLNKKIKSLSSQDTSNKITGKNINQYILKYFNLLNWEINIFGEDEYEYSIDELMISFDSNSELFFDDNAKLVFGNEYKFDSFLNFINNGKTIKINENKYKINFYNCISIEIEKDTNVRQLIKDLNISFDKVDLTDLTSETMNNMKDIILKSEEIKKDLNMLFI